MDLLMIWGKRRVIRFGGVEIDGEGVNHQSIGSRNQRLKRGGRREKNGRTIWKTLQPLR